MDKVGKHTLEVMSNAKWYNEWILSFIKPYLGENTLEIGAGIGNFTKLLSNYTSVTTIDYDSSYNRKLTRFKNKKINSGYGDIEKGKYFFKNKKFDTIVCLNVLEHIKDDKKALKNMQRLLKKGGTLFLLVPSHMFLYSNFDKNLGHYRRYSKGLLRGAVRSAGFGNNKIFYFNWWAAIGWYLFVTLSKRSELPKGKVSIFDKFGKFLLWPERTVKPPFGLSLVAICKK